MLEINSSMAEMNSMQIVFLGLCLLFFGIVRFRKFVMIFFVYYIVGIKLEIFVDMKQIFLVIEV